MNRRSLGVAIVLAIVTMGVAHADERAEAILLFEQGVKEMKAGNTAKACESFEKSNKLYADSGTKGSLAKCYEKLGKLASSWLLWRELADTAASSDLRKDAAKQAGRLDPKVPKYLVKAAPTPGLVVMINGKPSGLTGLPVPIDAGAVAIVATAPEHEPWKSDLTATEGKTLEIDIPALVAVKKDIVVQPPPTPGVDTSKRKKRRTLAALVGGVGLVTVAAGGFFGFSARGKFDDANTTCGGSVDNCIPDRLAAAQAQVDDARSAANLSSILFGAGGALVITGAVLWFTAPKPEQRTVSVSPLASPGAAGFVVSGRF